MTPWSKAKGPKESTESNWGFFHSSVNLTAGSKFLHVATRD